MTVDELLALAGEDFSCILNQRETAHAVLSASGKISSPAEAVEKLTALANAYKVILEAFRRWTEVHKERVQAWAEDTSTYGGLQWSHALLRLEKYGKELAEIEKEIQAYERLTK